MHLEHRLLLLESRSPRLAWGLLRLLALLQSFRQVGRRSMQRFTPAGKLLLLFYGFSLLFVMDTRATMNYQLFALLLVLLLISFFLAQRVRVPPGAMQARRVLPRTATAGVPLEYELLLRNTTGKKQASLQVLESLEPEHAARMLSGAKGRIPVSLLRVRLAWRSLLLGHGRPLVREAAAPTLFPGQEGRVRISALPPRRGVLRFSQSSLAAPDPLGLFRSFTPLPADQSLLVLPKQYATPRLPLSGGRRHNPGGLRMASRVGEEGEFTSLREYRRGDPLRHIHWRSWARHGKPIVKEFQEEFFTRHALVLDTFPEPGRVPTARDLQCFEAAVSAAASLAAAPRDQDALLDLLFVENTAHCVTAGRGLGSEEQLLEILAGVGPSLETESSDFGGFQTLAALVNEHAPLLSGCICIFLGWNTPRGELVDHLTSRGIEVLVLVVPMPGRRPQNLYDLEAAGSLTVLHPETLEQELAQL